MKAIVKCIMMQKISRIGSYRDWDIIKNAIYLQVRLESSCSGVKFDDDKYTICADGGYLLAKRMNVVPDVIIGDFDTFSEEELPDNCEIIKHPEDKDDTDTMLAVKLALNRGYKNIVICGAIGGRLDHTFANIQTLRYIMKHGGYGELAGDGSFAMMQGPGR